MARRPTGLRQVAPKTVMRNALTIDLEDWAQSTLAPDSPITDRFRHSTRRTLQLLRSCNVKATFFALGKAVELYPEVLREIHSEGHEIGSHGYGHELVYTLSPERFRDDVVRSIEVIQDIIGIRPIGYRAPAFSITKDALWAGPILASLGFAYSSSIFPFAGRRYGIPGSPRGPHRWDTCELWELPLPTLKIAGAYRPVCGGGYTRLLPSFVLNRLVRRLNQQGLPAVLYMHPYELDRREVKDLRRQGWRIPRRVGFMQSLFRSRVEGRLRALLQTFPFGTAAAVLGLNQDGKPIPDAGKTHQG
jgi:polysaccharide deacetylase family protein (PEP-CTERM system associated)